MIANERANKLGRRGRCGKEIRKRLNKIKSKTCTPLILVTIYLLCCYRTSNARKLLRYKYVAYVAILGLG